jgi:hypothetical protein
MSNNLCKNYNIITTNNDCTGIPLLLLFGDKGHNTHTKRYLVAKYDYQKDGYTWVY